MKIIVKDDYRQLSKEAARLVKKRIRQNPKIVLGLATGSTPLGLYQELINAHKKQGLDFSGITTFNLDEYLGLAPENQQSYHLVMKNNFFDKTDIVLKNTFFPNDFAPNFENYDKKIDDCGGIDLQILGIGRNGHIGFNEPGSDFSSKTREVKLSETTIKDNSRFFSAKGGSASGGDISQVPKTAATMGISTIMKAQKIILLAGGENKKEIIQKALSGPVTPEVPASILQTHKNVVAIVDKAAAKDLKLRN